MAKLVLQLSKFGMVGILAFLIDFAIITALTELLSFHYLLSSLLGFTISTIFNYVCSMKFVFNSKYAKSDKGKEAFIFLSLSIIGLILNQLSMYILVDFIAIHYMISKVFTTIVVMIWNFVSRKMLLEQ